MTEGNRIPFYMNDSNRGGISKKEIRPFKIERPLTSDQLLTGGYYNWKNQPERLIYIGQNGSWHQFVKVYAPETVWCEVLSEDLHMMEETVNP